MQNSHSHVCSAKYCDFAPQFIHGSSGSVNNFVCTVSGLVHNCGVGACDRSLGTVDTEDGGTVCLVSGLVVAMDTWQADSLYKHQQNNGSLPTALHPCEKTESRKDRIRNDLREDENPLCEVDAFRMLPCGHSVHTRCIAVVQSLLPGGVLYNQCQRLKILKIKNDTKTTTQCFTQTARKRHKRNLRLTSDNITKPSSRHIVLNWTDFRVKVLCPMRHSVHRTQKLNNATLPACARRSLATIIVVSVLHYVLESGIMTSMFSDIDKTLLRARYDPACNKCTGKSVHTRAFSNLSTLLLVLLHMYTTGVVMPRAGCVVQKCVYMAACLPNINLIKKCCTSSSSGSKKKSKSNAATVVSDDTLLLRQCCSEFVYVEKSVKAWFLKMDASQDSKCHVCMRMPSIDVMRALRSRMVQDV
jgi:hypothetical protein